jgi:hypothetical protein
MITTTTNPKVTASRFSRVTNAREYAMKKGRRPLTPEQHKEFEKMIAEFTNL